MPAARQVALALPQTSLRAMCGAQALACKFCDCQVPIVARALGLMAYILQLLIMTISMRALFDGWRPFHLLSFRLLLLPLLLMGAAVPVAAQEALPTVRVGVLKFGTVNWELDVIEARKLTKKIRVHPEGGCAGLGRRVDRCFARWRC